MTPRYSNSYIDQQLDDDDYDSLVEISRLICGARSFTTDTADYGLPCPGFLIVETLTWFAQSIRSSVWTYFEATPEARQRQMCLALEQFGPQGFADAYSKGMTSWRDMTRAQDLDIWAELQDDRANTWLHDLARQHRELIIELVA